MDVFILIFHYSGEERVLEGEKVDVRCTVSRYNYSEDSVGWYKLTVRGPEVSYVEPTFFLYSQEEDLP